MSIPDLIVKWIHVSSACLLLGAAALMLWGVAAPDAVPAGLLKRFKTLIHSVLGLLLLTGAYNFMRVLQQPVLAHAQGYQAVLGIKILVFAIIYALAIIVLKAMSREGAVSSRSRSLLTGLVLLALLAVFLSTYLNLDRIHLLTAGL